MQAWHLKEKKRVIIKTPRKNRKYRNREINKCREFKSVELTNTCRVAVKFGVLQDAWLAQDEQDNVPGPEEVTVCYAGSYRPSKTLQNET